MSSDSIKTIGVDARPLSSPMSGVARVISSILQYFPDKKNYRFILYSNRPPHADFESLTAMDHVEWSQGRGPLAKTGGTWFNLSLPFSMRKDNLSLFWGSQQVLPPGMPSGIPAVLTYYDLVLYYYPESMRALARIQQRLVQSYSVRRSSRILSISAQTRNDMVARFGYPENRALVSLLGYELKKGKSAAPDSDVLRRILPVGEISAKKGFILAVSTMEPRKNYPVLLDAFERYRSEISDSLPLVIAGRRGWESDEFFKRLDSMRSNASVYTVENASDEDLEILYRTCSFYVIPSRYEGFGLGLLEALAHGKYCIASDIGPFHEIGKKEIRYADPDDPEQWKNALTEATILLKKRKLKKPGFNLKEWSWRNTAKAHYDAFEEVLDV